MDTVDSGVHAYDRQTLIQYRNHAITNLHDDVLKKLHDLGLLRRPGLQSSASPEAGGWERGRRKRCSRKQKRGKWAGVRARLKTNPGRPAIPSIILSNICSLDNKLDYIRRQQTTWREYRDCCVFIFTETWLSDRVLDGAIQLDGLTVFRADRNAALCCKTVVAHLIEKLSLLGLNTSLCNWILDFLTGRPQSVRIGNSLSSTTTLSTGAPQGCSVSDRKTLQQIVRTAEKIIGLSLPSITDMCAVVSGTKMLAADPLNPVSCEVGPPWDGTCLSSTSHTCSIGLRSVEFGGQVNTKLVAVLINSFLNHFCFVPHNPAERGHSHQGIPFP
ncbi:hypothetical protein QTP70_032347 [Hemibagrus guttatus]|uniref:Uncharacterized protein n=1 Tax=Hemibagrus guttatus TaxID=175788 RepID=A0AAE0QIL4_9TELE|nr:hypothetical protein QTP70_032347 [Hemibagrus guttatus]KAK3553018.1 hypothetical protein QTP86_031156 [Hemibagrus guttatus]